jgi:predicted dehydrogenase
MTEIGVGLIGTGFMGECHAQAFASVGRMFEPPLQPRLEIVADAAAEPAQRCARRFGFARHTADWRALVADARVGLVSVTSPNAMHKEMALAAIGAGKHVWCEKPLAITASDARELAEAARAGGVTTLVGYNYLRSPAIQYAQRLVRNGDLGAVTYFRACFDEDYLANPAVPFSWRCERAKAGTGTLGDMGSHAISLARFLVGDIVEVSADMSTVVRNRPVAAPGIAVDQFSRLDPAAAITSRQVENEDIAHAIVRFASGIMGTIATSRVAWGRKNGMDFELMGTQGMLRFTQERFNELQLFLSDPREDQNGFRTILTGPAHPPYARFNPAVGHGIGFNDLKTAEAAHFLDAIAGKTRAYPDFAEGHEVERVVEAMVESAAQHRWVAVRDG